MTVRNDRPAVRQLALRGAGVLLAALALNGCGAAAPDAGRPGPCARSIRGTVRGRPFMVLRGTHWQRGRDHGYLAARDIIAVIDNLIRSAGLGSRAVGQRAYELLVVPQTFQCSWPPRYREELAGMLAGIREALPNPPDRVIPSLRREVSLQDLKACNIVADLVTLGCSSFAAWGRATPDGELIVGRNLEFLSSWGMVSGQCIIANEPAEEGLEPTIGFSWCGMVGCYTALNADGVFVAIHNSNGLARTGKRPWVPRTLALRSALEAAAVPAAVEDLARSLRTARPRKGNTVLAAAPARRDGKGADVAVLEWDGNGKEQGVTIRRPEEGELPGAIVCTNHFLSRSHSEPSVFATTKSRYRRLFATVARFAAGADSADFDGARRAIDEVAQAGLTHTVHSVIAWPAQRRLCVAYAEAGFSSPAGDGWFEFTWDGIFGAGSGERGTR